VLFGVIALQDEMAAVYGIRLLLCAKLALMTREHALLTRMRQTPFGWGQETFGVCIEPMALTSSKADGILLCDTLAIQI
jgi:hypothetical protein